MPDPDKPLPFYQVLEEEFIRFPHDENSRAYQEYAKARKEFEESCRDEAKEYEDEKKALASKLYRCIHELEPKRTALCLSGGGIRSATFALGVIQGLARHGLLTKFDYLSTVSGGGYIGSWLTAWSHHHAGGLPGVADELRKAPTSQPYPEPEPLRHLRSYSNYLSPKVGILSADTWTLVGTYLRNLFLNWLVLIPLLAALLMVPRASVAVIVAHPPEWLMQGCLAVGFLLGAFGIFYMGLALPSSSSELQARSPFWWVRREQRHFLSWCWLPLMGSAVLLTTFWAWLRQDGPHIDELKIWGQDPLLIFVLFGAALHLLSCCGYSWVLRSVNFWEVVITLLTGLMAGWLAWLGASKLFPHPLPTVGPIPQTELYACFASPLFLMVFLVAASVFVGLISRWTNDEDREWWARAGSWLLIAAAGWSVFSCLAVFGPLAFSQIPSKILAPLGGVTGFISLLAGWSARTVPNPQQASPAGPLGVLADKALVLAAALFLSLFAAVLSLGAGACIDWLCTAMHIERNVPGAESPPPYNLYGHMDTIHYTPWWLVVGLLVAAALLGLFMACFINSNKFSLHAMYRNRLIRAYLGASRKGSLRDPNPFTGFDPMDNMQMCELWPNAACRAPQTAPRDSRWRPMHVVNIALNLVKGKELAWQQRKAETFTVSPLHCGNYRLGYRRSEEYGGAGDWRRPFQEREEKRAISLGTAVTISGAAASPNMGYHSSPLLTLVMTLFNVRLGWWLGNPGKYGNNTYRYSAPNVSARPLICEALGLTDDESPYVYLSDGGHFENLGLYEMVLRRCRFIVLSDAGCDPEYHLEDLGNAIRKIRIDLGVPIEFEQKILIYSRHDKEPKENRKHCALGTIRYSAVDGEGTDGILIYIKPTFCGDESIDIKHYGNEVHAFPQEATSDQFFSESQFESYRMLGLHTMEQLCGTCTGALEMDRFVAAVREYLARS
ncbi:patatin-like phospholipase family protein [Desulforhabdus sp. TSK]|uniref:patatin-like phospholipase family protein n=2 Tax=Pseudomonadati TaxID=3379134 RepID=UPI001FC7FB54|nr:patatin-like phospholipase family protein [Desulforhabdus sp. TSK]GKT09193.1 hypothetical protein DSTSK_24980 [Desulforhabdus sp. TSK]